MPCSAAERFFESSSLFIFKTLYFVLGYSQITNANLLLIEIKSHLADGNDNEG